MPTPQRVFIIDCPVCGEYEIPRTEFFKLIPMNRVQQILQTFDEEGVAGAKISLKKCRKCAPEAIGVQGDVAILRRK